MIAMNAPGQTLAFFASCPTRHQTFTRATETRVRRHPSDMPFHPVMQKTICTETSPIRR
jgi:hypothetical protein